MILERKHIDLDHKVIFEKLVFEHPIKKKGVLENSACFLHFRNGNSTVYSATEQVNVGHKDSIVLQCGTYFNQFLKTGNIQFSEVYAVHLRHDLLRKIYKDELSELPTIINRNRRVGKIVSSELIDQFILSLEFYFSNPHVVTEELFILKVKELMLILMQSEYSNTIHELIGQLLLPRKIDLMEVVEAQLFSNLSVENLADLVGMSLSSFKRKFKEIYQESPAKYISHKRIEKAEDLLQHTALSISEIGYQLGFEYPQSFAKAFKRINGISAAEFRELHHQSS